MSRTIPYTRNYSAQPAFCQQPPQSGNTRASFSGGIKGRLASQLPHLGAVLAVKAPAVHPNRYDKRESPIFSGTGDCPTEAYVYNVYMPDG
jgi:hypothetical protein